MAARDRLDIDSKAPPFDQLKAVRLLAADRRGRDSLEHVRHQLYAAQDRQSGAHLLVKVTSKPGIVYERNLANEIATLTTINRERPGSPYFPVARTHGRLDDGRVYLVMSLFDEFPLATTIDTDRMPSRMVGHLRTAIEVARALGELHSLDIFHVDLNPMNILYRTDKGAPIVRVVDFESSYERARYADGSFYDPPTTPGFTAPEVAHQAPDARADVFSLGAVLYTMLVGYQWTWAGDITAAVEADPDLDAELRRLVLWAVDANPDTRCATAGQLQAGLTGYLEQIWPGRSW